MGAALHEDSDRRKAWGVVRSMRSAQGRQRVPAAGRTAEMNTWEGFGVRGDVLYTTQCAAGGVQTLEVRQMLNERHHAQESLRSGSNGHGGGI